MRAAAGLVAVALLGALVAFALPRAGRAANPTLIASVDDSAVISLTDSHGDAVTSVAPGTYDIEVHDTTTLHNFHLTGPGVDDQTSIVGTSATTWSGVTLTAGSYHFKCDAHPPMYGDFTVTTGATTTTPSTPSSTATSTTTAPTITAPAPPTTTSGPAEPCVVPSLVRKTLPVARRRLARTSCLVGRISRAYSHRVARGRILAQRPRAGRRVGYGTRVSLVVSRGRRR